MSQYRSHRISFFIFALSSLFIASNSFACAVVPKPTYLNESDLHEHGFSMESEPDSYCLDCADYEFVAPSSKSHGPLFRVQIKTSYKGKIVATWFPNPEGSTYARKYSALLSKEKGFSHEISFSYKSGVQCSYDLFIIKVSKT